MYEDDAGETEKWKRMRIEHEFGEDPYQTSSGVWLVAGLPADNGEDEERFTPGVVPTWPAPPAWWFQGTWPPLLRAAARDRRFDPLPWGWLWAAVRADRILAEHGLIATGFDADRGRLGCRVEPRDGVPPTRDAAWEAVGRLMLIAERTCMACGLVSTVAGVPVGRYVLNERTVARVCDPCLAAARVARPVMGWRQCLRQLDPRGRGLPDLP